jgi:hypothetical protein
MAFHYRLGILRFAIEQFRSLHSSRHIRRRRASCPLVHAPHCPPYTPSTASIHSFFIRACAQPVGCRYSARARDHMGSSEAFARRVLAPCYTHHKDIVIPPLLSDPQRRCHFFVAVEVFFQRDFKFQSPNKVLDPKATGRAVRIHFLLSHPSVLPADRFTRDRNRLVLFRWRRHARRASGGAGPALSDAKDAGAAFTWATTATITGQFRLQFFHDHLTPAVCAVMACGKPSCGCTAACRLLCAAPSLPSPHSSLLRRVVGLDHLRRQPPAVRHDLFPLYVFVTLCSCTCTSCKRIRFA